MPRKSASLHWFHSYRKKRSRVSITLVSRRLHSKPEPGGGRFREEPARLLNATGKGNEPIANPLPEPGREDEARPKLRDAAPPRKGSPAEYLVSLVSYAKFQWSVPRLRVGTVLVARGASGISFPAGLPIQEHAYIVRGAPGFDVLCFADCSWPIGTHLVVDLRIRGKSLQRLYQFLDSPFSAFHIFSITRSFRISGAFRCQSLRYCREGVLEPGKWSQRASERKGTRAGNVLR